MLERVHSAAIPGALATTAHVLTAPEATIHCRVDVTGAGRAAINEHGHSFVFMRVHSKFVKDVVPSCSNVSDITQGWHSKLIV